MINMHECVNVYVILGLYNLHVVILSKYKNLNQLDVIMICVAVNDMSKISYSAIGGGQDNTATGS